MSNFIHILAAISAAASVELTSPYKITRSGLLLFKFILNSGNQSAICAPGVTDEPTCKFISGSGIFNMVINSSDNALE